MSAPLIDARRARWLAMIVGATFFIEYLDTTIIATALPQMAKSFAISPNQLSIGMSAYMLALAVFIPISGWVADRFGTRTVFATAIAVFTVASILCGVSNGLYEFTAARLLQGMGGAMMVPVGRLIVVRNTEKSQLMKAISTITWPGIIAPMVGPPIGGFITTFASWRWIFLLNVPLGVACIVLVIRLVKNERSSEKHPLDGLGFVLSAIALTCLMYGTETAGVETASVLQPLLLIGASIVVGWVAVKYAARCAHPLLDFTTLKVPTFSVTVLTGSLTRVAVNAVPYLLPLLFQVGFGMSAFQSGLLLLASAAGNLGMKALTTPILRRFGFRTVALVDVALAGLFTALCGILTPHTPLPAILLVLFVYGLTRSLQFTALATLAYADIPPAQMSAASTLWSAAQQMMNGMGIAFGAMALRSAMYLRGGSGSYQMADFRWAFVFSAVLALLTLFGYFGLARDAGSKLSRASSGGGAQA